MIDRVSLITFSNRKKRFDNINKSLCYRVFLTKFKVCGNLINHHLHYEYITLVPEASCILYWQILRLINHHLQYEYMYFPAKIDGILFSFCVVRDATRVKSIAQEHNANQGLNAHLPLHLPFSVSRKHENNFLHSFMLPLT